MIQSANCGRRRNTELAQLKQQVSALTTDKQAAEVQRKAAETQSSAAAARARAELEKEKARAAALEEQVARLTQQLQEANAKVG